MARAGVTETRDIEDFLVFEERNHLRVSPIMECRYSVVTLLLCADGHAAIGGN
jgi:hypothetical protein